MYDLEKPSTCRSTLHKFRPRGDDKELTRGVDVFARIVKGTKP